jgi:hypothetical protein
MAQPDTARIKENVASMISQGAPETDIDAYVASEGTTPEALRGAGSDTSFKSTVQAGLSSALSGAGKTLKNAGLDGAGASLEDLGSKANPGSNYKPAMEEFQNKGGDGRNWSALPRVLAEGAPGFATDLLATLATRKIGGLGGAASYYLRNAGDTQNKRAAERTGDPNAAPTTEDKVIGGLTTGAEAAVNQIPLARIANPARIAGTGLAGVAGAGLEVGKKAGLEAATSAAQSAINQAGTTAGTKGGLRIDPTDVVDSGIVGGVTGGAFSAPRGVKDTISATRFRDVGGDLQPASTALAERIRSRVGDDSELQSPQTAYRAVDEAKREVHNELKAAGASTTDPQVTNAIDRATSGRTLTGQDLAAIDKVGDPNLSMLARQAHVADVLTSKGNFDTGSERFAGGLSEQVRSIAAHHPVLATMLGGGGALAAAARMGPIGLDSIAANVPAFAGTAAAGIGGYLALSRAEKALGLRSPAHSFVEKFSQDGAPVRVVTPDVRAPQNPTGPRVAQASTFNGKPLDPPFGVAPVATPADVARRDNRLTGTVDKALTRGVREQNRDDARQEASVDSGADLIGRNAVAQVRGERRIAAMKERQAAYAERQALQEQKVDATGLVKSRDANLKVMQQDAQQTAQAKRANEALDRRSLSEQKQDATGLMQARKSPNEGDRAQATDARELMAARRAHEKAQAQADAAEGDAMKAKAALSDNGLDPSTLKSAQKLIKSLSVVQKLKDRAEKAQAAVEKKQAAQEKMAAKAQAKATKPAAAPKTNGKSNGKANGHDTAPAAKKLDDYPEAPWAYADTNREAAKMVLDHEQANGRSIAHPDGYTRSVERRLNGLDDALLAVGKDATSHGDKEVVQSALARIKSTRSPAAAKEFKEVLKQELPQLSASIEKHLSDGKLDELWKPARSKLH